LRLSTDYVRSIGVQRLIVMREFVAPHPPIGEDETTRGSTFTADANQRVLTKDAIDDGPRPTNGGVGQAPLAGAPRAQVQ
jgi:hypothetical protein